MTKSIYRSSVQCWEYAKLEVMVLILIVTLHLGDVITISQMPKSDTLFKAVHLDKEDSKPNLS